MKKWLAKQQAKASLIKAFRNGEIGNHYSYSSNSGFIYPKIHAVDIQKTKLTYVFTIPQLRLKNSRKHDWDGSQGN